MLRGTLMCIETCGMLVWQVVDGYFHSIDLHCHIPIHKVQVNIAASGKRKILFSFVHLWTVFVFVF